MDCNNKDMQVYENLVHHVLFVGLLLVAHCFGFYTAVIHLFGYQISPSRGCTNLVVSNYALFYAIQINITSNLTWITMIVFSILTLGNVRGGRRIQIITQNTGNVPAAASNTPQNINRRRREMQLIKLSLIQVVRLCSSFYDGNCLSFYAFITISQKKSSDQLASDAFFNLSGLLLLCTYSAVCLIIS